MRKVLTPVRLPVALLVALTGAGLSACGSASTDSSSAGQGATSIVVTTSVLGEVVTSALDDLSPGAVDIQVIIPAGADPHEFGPSARQAEAMENADVLVVNGLGIEEGMIDIIEAVQGTGTVVFDVGERAATGAADPHVWMDPNLVADALGSFADVLADATELDSVAVASSVSRYIDELLALDSDIAALLAPIPADRRTLVTNHETLGYFAARYDFEVVGSVISSLSTNAEASASDLEQLAEIVRDRGIPAIFAETTASGRLAETVASEAGNDVQVVELFTESPGGPGSGAESYIGMMKVNAERIAAALQ